MCITPVLPCDINLAIIDSSYFFIGGLILVLHVITSFPLARNVYMSGKVTLCPRIVFNLSMKSACSENFSSIPLLLGS